jgi:S-DNA-T family DNA segregation ATPase FtsK/SpoIIIE
MNRKKQPLNQSKQEEILGILLMTLAILIALSLITYSPNEQPGNIKDNLGQIENKMGVAGVYISYFLVQVLIGYPSFVFPIIIFMIGWTCFRENELAKTLRISAYLFAFALYTSIILAIPEVTSKGESAQGFALSGIIGGLLAQVLFNYIGIAGSIVILLALIMITIIGATRVSFSELLSSAMLYATIIYDKVQKMIARTRSARPQRTVPVNLNRKTETVINAQPKPQPIVHSNSPKPELRPTPRPVVQKPPAQMEIPASPEDDDLDDAETPTERIDPGNYQFPPLELLTVPPDNGDEISKEELQANAQLLEDRLQEFDVQGKVVEISPGPVITRYEYEPAPGIKISRIASLADDLALAMRAKRIRIIAPIPGKAAVGVEIPNRIHQTVFLQEVLSSSLFQQSDSPLTLALGKTIAGEPYVSRLDEMPHLLIAGSTGSGKSVCLNTIIASLLYKAHPLQLQLVLIDPKRLELSVYNHLRHHHLTYREDLNEEVVTTANNAISILKSVESVMEKRYETLARAGVRNIKDYNVKVRNGQLQAPEGEPPFEPLEYLVVIIDELADLMLTAAREVEEPIARLTQMSRAVGIHLIVATQRPSVDVITGVIKANFPARIAFQVASKTDSRTILDANGAEKLLGMGDMLFIPPGRPEPVRLHGALILSEEIEGIISHIRKQPRYPKHLLPVGKEEAAAMFDPDGLGGSRDELFNEAAKLVVRHQQGSISLLQRRLKVGYARAARLIDELEAAGVVGPFDGSKAREVLVSDEEVLADMGLN